MTVIKIVDGTFGYPSNIYMLIYNLIILMSRLDGEMNEMSPSSHDQIWRYVYISRGS